MSFLDITFSRFLKDIISKHDVNNRVLLINPLQLNDEIIDEEVVSKRGYYVYPPMGLLFLASRLLNENFDVRILDLNYEYLKKLNTAIDSKETSDYEEILEEFLEKFNPSVVGFSCMFSYYYPQYSKIINYVNRRSKYITIAGGCDVSVNYKTYLINNKVNFCLENEGEETIVSLVNALVSQDLVSSYKGIYYLFNGEVLKTNGKYTYPDISSYDIRNAYELIDISSYCKVGSLNQYSRVEGLDIPFATVSISRGCRGRCTFCAVHKYVGSQIRMRGIDTIISELKYLKSKGIKQIDFIDDDLLWNKEYSMMLFKRMIEERIDIIWYVNNGIIASTVDREMLQLMIYSGCKGFKIGVESGNPEMLKMIKKPATIDKLINFGEICCNYKDIFIAGNYILGFPNELFGQMLDTFFFANKIKLDWAGFYICQPIKGAEAFNAFTEIGNYSEEVKPNNYMPVRNDKLGELKNTNVEGLDVFKININEKIGHETLQEIWFVFGFYTNFINNKNLRSNPSKFINWVKVAMSAYPHDCGMAAFLYLAYILIDDFNQAKVYNERAYNLYLDSEYWRKRFKQFSLEQIFEVNANSRQDVLELIKMIERQNKKVIKENLLISGYKGVDKLKYDI